MPKRDEKKGKQRGLAVSALWGVISGFIIIFALFMIASSFVLSGKLPEGAMKAVTAISSVLGAAAGAVVSIKRRKSKILITGLTCGVVMFFVMLLSSVSLNTSGVFNGLTPLLCLMTVLGGAFGALLCKRRKKHKKGQYKNSYN